MTVSVIIPVFNEASIIQSAINWVIEQDVSKSIIEVIVVDGGSNDGTKELAAKAGAKVVTSCKGRARQMNAGAAIASGNILYFLHADTRPPKKFITYIQNAINAGYVIGCFRLKFNIDHWFLQANAWFTRLNINTFRFGDQSLFVTGEIFNQSGGFNEQLIVLEDQEMIMRLKKYGKFTIMPAAVITSSRKYITNGIYKTQAVYFLIYMMYRLGYSQERLVGLYKKLIRQDKL